MHLDRTDLIEQYQAAIDVLEHALQTCPDELWEASVWTVKKSDPWIWPAAGVEPVPERTVQSIQRFSAFWVVAYHCLWFLDFYVTNDVTTFQSPDPVRGGPEEQGFASDGAVAVPAGDCSREVLLDYVAHCRRKVTHEIVGAAESDFRQPRPRNHPHAGKTYGALLKDNLAHVREHGEQLRRFLDDATKR